MLFQNSIQVFTAGNICSLETGILSILLQEYGEILPQPADSVRQPHWVANLAFVDGLTATLEMSSWLKVLARTLSLMAATRWYICGSTPLGSWLQACLVPSLRWSSDSPFRFHSS